MNRGISINTLKMISSKNTIDAIKKIETSQQDITSNINNNIAQVNDIDYNFCKVYYDTQNMDLINKLSQSGIKNMINLNSKIDPYFNWKNYSKFCPQFSDNEILVKKHYLEKINEKLFVEQLLNIIIIKTSNRPLDTIFREFDNINIQFSLLTEARDDFEHYNVKNYLCNKNNQLSILNNILKINTAKYFMIVYDYNVFEYNFISKITKDLNNLINLNALLLVQNSLSIDTEISKKTDFFRIKTDFLRKITDPYICVINNEIKQDFDYSMSEIGIILYINQITNKYNSILATTDYLFKNNNDTNNKLIIKDITLLFDLYVSNIENDIINEYILNSQNDTNIVDGLELSKSNLDTVNNLLNI